MIKKKLSVKNSSSCSYSSILMEGLFVKFRLTESFAQNLHVQHLVKCSYSVALSLNSATVASKSALKGDRL